VRWSGQTVRRGGRVCRGPAHQGDPERHPQTRPHDAGLATVALLDQFAGWEEALEGSEAAQQLADAGLGDDVAFAARPDRYGVVPVYADRRIT